MPLAFFFFFLLYVESEGGARSFSHLIVIAVQDRQLEEEVVALLMAMCDSGVHFWKGH